MSFCCAVFFWRPFRPSETTMLSEGWPPQENDFILYCMGQNWRHQGPQMLRKFIATIPLFGIQVWPKPKCAQRLRKDSQRQALSHVQTLGLDHKAQDSNCTEDNDEGSPAVRKCLKLIMSQNWLKDVKGKKKWGFWSSRYCQQTDPLTLTSKEKFFTGEKCPAIFVAQSSNERLKKKAHWWADHLDQVSKNQNKNSSTG